MRKLEKKLKKSIRKVHPEWSNLRVAQEAEKLANAIKTRQEKKRQAREGDEQV